MNKAGEIWTGTQTFFFAGSSQYARGVLDFSAAQSAGTRPALCAGTRKRKLLGLPTTIIFFLVGSCDREVELPRPSKRKKPGFELWFFFFENSGLPTTVFF